MSQFDLVVRSWLLQSLPYVVVIVLLWILIKKRKIWKPKLVACLMNRFLKSFHWKFENQKRELFNQLVADSVRASPFTILEIGAGSGLNFKYYPDNSTVICLDPNPFHEYYIRQNKEILNPKVQHVEFLRGYAEKMPEIPDRSVDAVTCTLVLCTVRDPHAVFSEIKRVLKPGGKFYYLEHMAAEKRTFGRMLQELLNPLWKQVCDGCNLQRETMRLIKEAGFASVKQHKFLLKAGPCVYMPGLWGTATK